MRILELDIETAPNVGYFWQQKTGFIPIGHIVEDGYTLCWAAKWHGEKEIIFRSVYEDGEKKMLEDMHALLCEADAVVHYNGVKFDIPVLNAEFFLRGMLPPTPFHQIDLFKTVRKRFRFTSNKLDYVARRVGIGAKVQHKGMDLWRECMAGNAKAWATMKRYNIQDVRLLEKLYRKLLPWIQDHPNHALFKETDRPVCTNCGSHYVVKNGVETTKTMQYQRYKCKSCGTPLRGRFTVLPKEKRKHVLTQSKI